MHRRVVLTGLGAVTPCGNDVPTTWDAILSCRSGIVPVTRFDVTGWPSRIAGEVRDFDANALFGRRDARRLGRFMHFAVAASDEALADAGFDRAGSWPEAERFGVYIGTGIGGFPEICEMAVELHEKGRRRVSPLFVPRSLNNLATGAVSIRHDARGPSLCISTACAVGNHSIGEAWRAIRLGDADVVLAGGTESALSPLGYAGFMNMRALSRNQGDPTRASRPFDRDRDGFVMAEGAGLVVLEGLEHAEARGARIYCELIGYGNSTDAYHITAPSPEGEGAARCMRLALRSAGLQPEEVDHVNAHGTSTQLNDPNEVAAIRAVFGEHAERILVCSTKGVTGHTLGAAGGIEAVATALTLHTGLVPATANLDHPDPECTGVDLVRSEPRAAHPRIALSNAFGFGGTNATLAFARWDG